MARRFNGTSDHIDYSHDTFYDGQQTLSISAWVYPETAIGNYGHVISQQKSDYTSGFAMLIQLTDPTQLFFVYRNSGSNSIICTTGAVGVGTWSHIYAVFDGASFTQADRFRLWINGTEYPHANFSTFDTLPSDLGNSSPGKLRVGCDEALAYFWAGRIAEIGLWNSNDMNSTKIADLASGKAPSFYPSFLRSYLPYGIGDGAGDVQGHAGAPTIVGTTEVSHPPGITYPGSAESVRADGRVLIGKL
jgi:concanavalin A-like lectin/glucanase superfamily protein